MLTRFIEFIIVIITAAIIGVTSSYFTFGRDIAVNSSRIDSIHGQEDTRHKELDKYMKIIQSDISDIREDMRDLRNYLLNKKK